jgi:transposase
MSMRKNTNGKQDAIILKTLDELVPKNHIVRKMEGHLDLSFVYEEVSHLYSDVGQKSLDPVVFFKILLIRYMFGIKSIRETMRQIEVNLAYRWYLGLTFEDSVPHHSTMTQIYKRKYKDSDIFEKIFLRILEIADESSYIDCGTIYADATHIKANANKRKYSEEVVETVTSIKTELLEDINEKRRELGKKEIKLEDYNPDEDDNDDDTPKPPAPRKKLNSGTKRVKVSNTDDEAGFYYRNEKEKGFVYQDHRVVEDKNNFIIASRIEPGNIHDAKVLEKVLLQLKERGVDYQNIALDSGYNSLEIMHYFEQEEKESIIAHRRFGKSGQTKKPVYCAETDTFVCELGCVFDLKNVDKQGYMSYHCASNCKGCPTPCFSASEQKKVFRRHIHQYLREKNTKRRLSEEGKAIYARRKETVERSFADAKQNHGLRWTLYRGQKKNQNYNWLLCAAQNLKKLCILKSRDYARQMNEDNSSFFGKITDLFKRVALYFFVKQKTANSLAFKTNLSTV